MTLASHYYQHLAARPLTDTIGTRRLQVHEHMYIYIYILGVAHVAVGGPKQAYRRDFLTQLSSRRRFCASTPELLPQELQVLARAVFVFFCIKKI